MPKLCKLLNEYIPRLFLLQVYILKVVWCDGNINIIYRTCSDFFFLQVKKNNQKTRK